MSGPLHHEPIQSTPFDVLTKDVEDVHDRFKAFKFASAGTTQRIKSRKVGFPSLYKALLPEPIQWAARKHGTLA